MKKRLVAVLVMVVVMMAGCGNSNSAEEPTEADNQMTENETDELSTIEGTVLEINETSILINESGYENGECYLILSDDTVIYVDGEKSDISMIEVGQIIKARYAGGIEEIYPGKINEVIEIMVEHSSETEGILAVGENTITFDGVITDNAIDTLVPTICIEPLLDEIPYDAVFFELPDDAVEWASQINSVVTITCTDTFTEQSPHYGTLISIIGITTETDNLLITVAGFWDREGAVKLSAEDAAVVSDLVKSGSWSEGTSDCQSDCLIFMDDEEIQYHSGCGTFNDTVNEKRLHLTEEQQAEVNAILEKYIVLEQSLEYAPVTEKEPAHSAESSGTPQNGTIQDGKIYILGFGWVDYEGGGTEGIYAEDMYENGNKIGIME